MIRIILDYFSINKSRQRKDFLRIFLPLLLVEFGVVIKAPVVQKIIYPLYVIIVLAILLMIFAALFVGLIGVLDAYVRGKRLAREANMSPDEYVRSEGYRRYGKEKLMRTDKPRKWL